MAKSLKVVIVLIVVQILMLNTYGIKGASFKIDLGENEEAYEVHEDDLGAYEQGAIDNGFIQNYSKKPSFKKNKIEGIASNVHTDMVSAIATSDDYIIGALSVNNINASQNDPTKALVHTMYFSLLDNQGQIVEYQQIPVANDEWINTYSNTLNNHTVNQYGDYGMSIEDEDKLTILYFGQRPGDITNKNRIVTASKNSQTHKLQLDYRDVDLNSYVLGQQITRGTLRNDGSISVHGYFTEGNTNKTTFEVYNLDLTSGKYTSKRELESPNYDDYSNVKYPAWALLMQQLVDMNGGEVAHVLALDLNNLMLPVSSLVLYDNQGSIQKTYIPNSKGAIKILREISTKEELFFVEQTDNGGALKKVVMSSLDIELVQSFEGLINIDIFEDYDSNYQTKYRFFGSVYDAVGPFSQFGNRGGAVVGTMNDDFTVYNASILESDEWVVINGLLKLKQSDDYAIYGLTNSKSFANEPSYGWPDQNTMNEDQYGGYVFVGTTEITEDYSPWLKLTSKIIVNQTSPELEKDLLQGIDVFDEFDMSSLGGSKTKEWLMSRINKNPLNHAKPIDWLKLGVDLANVGPYQGTYFVVDGSAQQTTSSRIVNVIGPYTTVSSSETTALDAKNFTISLSNLQSLDLATILDESNANVKSWDMNTRDILTRQVDVVIEDLDYIKSQNKKGIFDLTLKVSNQGEVLSRTIKVIVVDDTASVSKKYVLYADYFVVNKQNLLTFSDQINELANVVVIDIDSGAEVNNPDISLNLFGLDILDLDVMVGPNQVQISLNQDGSVNKNVMMNIVDENTTIDLLNQEAIHATNLTIDIDQVNDLDQLIQYQAWHLKTGQMIQDVNIDVSNVESRIGTYEVELKTVNQTTHQIKVNVIDDGVIVYPSDQEMIKANYIVTHINDYDLIDDQYIKTQAQLQAHYVDRVDAYDLSSITVTSHILKEVGPYLVTFTTAKGNTYDVYLSIVDENTTIDLLNQEAIHANNAVVENQFNMLDDSKVLEATHAKAWNLITGEWISDLTVTALPQPFSVLHLDEGVNLVSITTPKQSTKIAMITRMSDQIVIDPSLYEALMAKDFTIDVSQVQNLMDEDLVLLAKVKYWNYQTGQILDNSTLSINRGELLEVVGLYNIEFKTSNGLSKKIRVQVIDNNTIIDNINREMIVSYGFKVEKTKVSTLTVDDYLTLGKVVAWDLDTGNRISQIEVDYSRVLNQNGTYEVTFTTKKGTSKTSGVLVYSDETKQEEIDPDIINPDHKKETDKTHNQELPNTGISGLTEIGILSLLFGLLVLLKKNN